MKQKKQSSSIFRRFWLVALLSLLALFILLVIGGTLWFRAYLRSDAFRQMVSKATSRTIKADGKFQPFEYTGTTIYSDGFNAQGNPGAFFSSLQAMQIRADFNLRGVLKKEWQIDQLEIGRVKIRWKNAGEKPPAPPQPSANPANGEVRASSHSWPVKIKQALVKEMDLEWTGGSLHDAAFSFSPDDGADGGWEIKAWGGSLSQRNLPDLKLEKADLRYRPKTLYMTDCVFREGEAGRISANGEVDFGEQADVQMKISGIDIAPFLSSDWRAKLTGDLNGDVKIHWPISQPTNTASTTSLTTNANSKREISGTLQLAHAHLTALPVLDQVALFTHTQQFRRLNLTTASAHFKKENGSLTMNDIVIEDSGLLKIKGSCVIRNGEINGTFQVGVTPASLQWIPGSQEKVFTTTRDGYLWTTVTLIGPAAHPRENLTSRLIAAAQGAVIDKAQEIIKNPAKGVQDATKGAFDLLKPFVQP